MTAVTDPALLAQLNAPQPVTDPALLAQLNSPDQPSAPTDPNFFQRVQQDWQNNKAAGEASDAAVSSGEISPLHYGFQTLGQGVVGDIAAPITEGVRSAISLIPEPQGAKDVLGGLSAHVQQYLADKPNLARDLQSLLNVAAVIPAADAVGNAARSGINAASDAAWDAKPLAPKTMPVTGAPLGKPSIEPDVAKGIGQDLYRGAAQYGGSYNKSFNDALSGSLEKYREASPYAGDGSTNVNKWIDQKKTTLAKAPVSLHDYDLMDKDLGEKAYSTMDAHGTMTNEGKTYLQMQQDLRARALNPQPSDIDNPAAFQAHKLATSVYSDYFKLRDIKQIQTKAELTDNPAQAFRTGMKNLYTNAKKTTGYSKEDLALLRQGAETGATTGLLRVVGSRLNAIGAYAAAGGGPAGMMAGGVTYAGGRAASALANKLQTAPINKLTDIIGARVSGNAAAAQDFLRTAPPISPPAPPPMDFYNPGGLAQPAGYVPIPNPVNVGFSNPGGLAQPVTMPPNLTDPVGGYAGMFKK